MSEERIPGARSAENPVDLIKRTIKDRIVIIHPLHDANTLKFRAEVIGEATVILQHREGGWFGDHCNNELVAQLGQIIESASD